MTLEITSKHLDDTDIIIAKYKLLGQDNYIQGAFTHTLEGAQILNSIYEEVRDKDKPVIQPPTQDDITEFVELLLTDISNLSDNIKKDADVPLVGINTVLYLMAWSKFKQAEMFLKVFYEEKMAEKKEFDEYNSKLKSAKNIILLINEDMNHKQAEFSLKSIWPSIFEKEAVYIHNDWKPRTEEYMKAPNIFFDSLHCDECLVKFKSEETVYFLIGFKQGQKLPVDLPKDAYYVGI